MFSPGILQQRIAERDNLLEGAVRLLKNDQRVVAAWLHGSLGRGSGDAWSDIDLWAVVADEHLGAIRSEHHEFASRLAEPLLLVDAPQNAPTDGAFLSALYAGEVAGPHHVDWTWQAQSAAVPISLGDIRMLFSRVEMAQKPTPAPQEVEEGGGIVANEIAYFWMMLPIAAKYVMRGQPWKVVNALAFTRYALDKVGWQLGAVKSPPEYPTSSANPPPVEPTDQIVFLQDLAREAEGLIQTTGRGYELVSLEARQQVGLVGRSRVTVRPLRIT